MNHLDFTFEDTRIIATKVNKTYHTLILDLPTGKVKKKEFSELSLSCILQLILIPELTLSREEVWKIAEDSVKDLPLEFRMIL